MTLLLLLIFLDPISTHKIYDKLMMENEQTIFKEKLRSAVDPPLLCSQVLENTTLILVHSERQTVNNEDNSALHIMRLDTCR